eukprot:3044245-Prymnesium_polylepis.1
MRDTPAAAAGSAQVARHLRSCGAASASARPAARIRASNSERRAALSEEPVRQILAAEAVGVPIEQVGEVVHAVGPRARGEHRVAPLLARLDPPAAAAPGEPAAILRQQAQ